MNELMRLNPDRGLNNAEISEKDVRIAERDGTIASLRDELAAAKDVE